VSESTRRTCSRCSTGSVASLRVMAHYVDVLMQAGFSREEALTIAIAWQQNMQASDG
jgi:hypothetical protein